MTKADLQPAQDSSPSTELRGAGRKLCSSLLFQAALVGFALLAASACTVLSTRPVQEMSDTASAIRAAREVQADTLAPELFRQANEWFFKAKHEYKFKNFKLAKDYADKSRLFAEDAEFEAIRNGGNRTETSTSDPMASGIASPPSLPLPTPSQTPYAYPTPTGTPADAPPPTGSTPTSPTLTPPAP
jgi:hypothetical protein